MDDDDDGGYYNMLDPSTVDKALFNMFLGGFDEAAVCAVLARMDEGRREKCLISASVRAASWGKTRGGVQVLEWLHGKGLLRAQPYLIAASTVQGCYALDFCKSIGIQAVQTDLDAAVRNGNIDAVKLLLAEPNMSLSRVPAAAWAGSMYVVALMEYVTSTLGAGSLLTSEVLLHCKVADNEKAVQWLTQKHGVHYPEPYASGLKYRNKLPGYWK